MNIIEYVKAKLPEYDVIGSAPINQDAIVLIVASKDRERKASFSISGLEMVQNNEEAMIQSLVDERLAATLCRLNA